MNSKRMYRWKGVTTAAALAAAAFGFGAGTPVPTPAHAEFGRGGGFSRDDEVITRNSSSLQVRVTTDREEYATGRSVGILMTLTNRSDRGIQVNDMPYP